MAWANWRNNDLEIIRGYENLKKGEDPDLAIAFARLEINYFVHGAWFDNDRFLIDGVDKIRSIPVIVQGSPVKSAWDLHKEWPEAELKIITEKRA